MAKISKPVMYLALVAAGAAIYVLTSPNAPVAHTAPPKTLHRNALVNGQFTDADFSTKFAEPVLVSRDAFKPGVARKTNALAVALLAAGGIPADLAGGDPNWVCTGVSEVNGVRQALLENKVTNDGEFVKQGDKWKSAVVSQVLEDGLVMVGNDSEPKTIHIQQDNTQAETDTGDTTPVRPSLTGVIGSGAGGTVQALPAPDSNSQAGNNNAG
jgi:hypothetical protein